MRNPSITPAELCEIFCYDSDSGQLFWKKAISDKIRGGERAGAPHSQGYRQVCFNRTKMFEHRVIWALVTGQWPTKQIDHRNGNRSDNRWTNLREAEQNMNSANMRKRSSNRSGFKGVVHVKPGTWLAYIHIEGKTKYLGTYRTPESARDAYVAAAIDAWGEFARAA